MADRDGILNSPEIEQFAWYDTEREENCYSEKGVKIALDTYMKATCLELLEYMAKNLIMCCMTADGVRFSHNRKMLTKEQLFENFL